MIFGQLALISFGFWAALVTLFHSVNIIYSIQFMGTGHSGRPHHRAAPTRRLCLPRRGECINFAAPYDNAISSFSTDDGESHDWDPDCYGTSIGGITPAANLTSLPPGFDNAISSFRCFYDIE
ncbi:hypothetical protein C8J57DRAFT_1240472 [Mycena rebaudengoi]|nr:hypothetical protein C8J57DRAFT_1240472 [Mycena rebaudengoi]